MARASASTSAPLARAIQHDVRDRFGVELEAEPVCL
jgi:UDP-N-acetylmuramate dehydrogenase